MQRYFIKGDKSKDPVIYMDDVMHKHMKKVLRYTNGKQVICIDEYKHVMLCTVADIEEGVLVRESFIEEDHELPVKVTLIYGMPKGDKFEFVLQKATELGVHRIVPFLSQRSLIKMDEKRFMKKHERYMRIIQEACEQCEREVIPGITMPVRVSELHNYLSEENIVAYEEEGKKGEGSILREVLNKHPESITIIVGPEGGFDESEIDIMKDMDIKPCGLGKRILRSETAPLYLLSVIGYESELR